MFTIYDNQSESFGHPFYVANEKVATRLFIDEINKPESFIKAHPNDFTLVRIGTYDDSKAIVTGLPKPELVAKATSFVATPTLTPSAKE